MRRRAFLTALLAIPAAIKAMVSATQSASIERLRVASSGEFRPWETDPNHYFGIY